MSFFFYVIDLFVSFLQKLECPKVKGQLLIFGATNWDLIGRKEVPKQQGTVFLHHIAGSGPESDT